MFNKQLKISINNQENPALLAAFKENIKVTKSPITRPATPALFHGRCPLVYAFPLFIYFAAVL